MPGYKFNTDEFWYLLAELKQSLSIESPITNLLTRFEVDTNEEIIQRVKYLLNKKRLLPPSKQLAQAINVIADPDSQYTIVTRLDSKVSIGEFYNKRGNIAEFSYDENGTIYLKQSINTAGFVSQILDLFRDELIPNENKTPEKEFSFSFSEYTILSVIFHLEQTCRSLGDVEDLGFIYFNKEDIVEHLKEEGRFEPLNFLLDENISNPVDSLTDIDDELESVINNFIEKGYLDKVGQHGDLSVGQNIKKLFNVVRRRDKIISTFSSYQIQEDEKIQTKTTSLLWSKKAIYAIEFLDSTVNFIRLYKKHQIKNLIIRTLEIDDIDEISAKESEINPTPLSPQIIVPSSLPESHATSTPPPPQTEIILPPKDQATTPSFPTAMVGVEKNETFPPSPPPIPAEKNISTPELPPLPVKEPPAEIKVPSTPPVIPVQTVHAADEYSLTKEELMVINFFKNSAGAGKLPKREVRYNRFSIFAAMRTSNAEYDQQLMRNIETGANGLVLKGLAVEPDKDPTSKIGISLTDEGYKFLSK